LNPLGYQVSLQGGLMHCLTSLSDGRGVFQTKPDILIRRGGEVVHVIDTKWKRIASRIEDRKQGVSQSDVYQMMAYAHLYKAPRLTLLYPHHEGLSEGEGVQARFRISGQETIIDTVSLDVADGAGVVARLRDVLIAPQMPVRYHA
jgi:5-methylcytosine-specific restriction enzyme subunit McrC